tara:strand:- start:2430 stop:3536 length:1107 start_codon:yes stop_codon:yes gene_type:complete
MKTILKINSLLTFLLISTLSCKTIDIKSDLTTINHNNKEITYEGRIGKSFNNSASEIYWSGTSIKLNFNGTFVKVILEDENGSNYFNVILDGTNFELLKLNKGKQEYILAKNLPKGNHSIELIKRNEWTYGKTLFYNFEVKGKLLDKDPEKKLFIEFYGDSVTTGHGNEDYSGDDKPEGNVTNNYYTYAAMTARNFNAAYSCIARGGIGIMVSWFNMIMPEMYDRLNPNDANSKWDFTSKQPDIVVINLLQNDSWIVNYPDNKEFKRRFGNQKPSKEKIVLDYSNFIKTIRAKYNNASIICLLGNMDITKEGSTWPNYVEKAINELNDLNIYTCIVPYKDSPDHPKVKEHEIIAKKLTTLIKNKLINN